MRTICEAEIKEEVYVCPYCMSDIPASGSCCGENGHQELAYILADGDCLLASDVKLVEEERTLH